MAHRSRDTPRGRAARARASSAGTSRAPDRERSVGTTRTSPPGTPRGSPRVAFLQERYPAAAGYQSIERSAVPCAVPRESPIRCDAAARGNARARTRGSRRRAARGSRGAGNSDPRTRTDAVPLPELAARDDRDRDREICGRSIAQLREALVTYVDRLVIVHALGDLHAGEPRHDAVAAGTRARPESASNARHRFGPVSRQNRSTTSSRQRRASSRLCSSIGRRQIWQHPGAGSSHVTLIAAASRDTQRSPRGAARRARRRARCRSRDPRRRRARARDRDRGDRAPARTKVLAHQQR